MRVHTQGRKIMCQQCEEAHQSNSKKPFCPQGGTVNSLSYIARCGQYWLQMNDHFHLWQEATKDEVDDFIREAG